MGATEILTRWLLQLFAAQSGSLTTATANAELESYYDRAEVCSEAANAHFKAAIQTRNKAMVERSDMVICCIEHNSGGAYTAVKYAIKLGKKVVNVAEDQV